MAPSEGSRRSARLGGSLSGLASERPIPRSFFSSIASCLIASHAGSGPLQAEYEASDPCVVAVGGTALTLNAAGQVTGTRLGDRRRQECARHQNVAFDACLVAVNDAESASMKDMLTSGLVDDVSVNTTAIILGDNLFVKPPHPVIEKTRLIMEAGATPQLAVYTDGDVDDARRLQID
jgi:hypothetical protein